MRPKIFRIFDENDQTKVKIDACLSLLPAVTFFDPALLEYAENFTRIQLKHDAVLSNTFTLLNGGEGYPVATPLKSDGIFGLNWYALIPSSPVVTPWGWTGASSTYIGASIGGDSQYVHMMDGNGSGGAGRYDETDDFSVDFEFQVDSANRNAIGFYKRDNVDSTSNSVQMWMTGGKFYIIINTIGTVSTLSAAVNTRYWMRLSYTAGTNLARLIIWSDNFDGTEVENITIARAAETFDCDSFGFASQTSNPQQISGRQQLYQIICSQVDFGTYTTTSPLIYNRMNFFVDDANIHMSRIPIPFGGVGIVKEKYFADNEKLIPSEVADRATIDAGLNASFLTDPQRRAEPDQTGHYLYRVFQFASDGTQTAWIDEQCNLRAGNFVPAVAGGGGLIIHPGMGGGINA